MTYARIRKYAQSMLSPLPLSTQMQLPSELIAHVLTYIPCDAITQPWLARMALVCCAWAPSAQGCLYRHVHVHRKHQWRQIQQTLQTHPDRRCFVQTLEFRGVPVTEMYFGWSKWASVDYEIVISLPHLARRSFGILFPNLQRILLCRCSTSALVLRQLMNGSAQSTLRHVALVGTSSNWADVTGLFQNSGIRWEDIRLVLPVPTSECS